MKKLLLVFLISIVLISSAPAYDGNEPKNGAPAPEAVYMKYVNAVHRGDLSFLKTLIYSKTRALLWDKNGPAMLAMTKNTIPKNPTIVSKKPLQEFQYNYMILNMSGRSDRNQTEYGEVKMIVENGEWKVFEEKWKAR